MLSSSMLPIVFRLINFALFIVLLVYGFRRYIYDALRTQMAERDKARRDLEEKKELLARIQSRLDEQMHINERIHKELMLTLHTWRQSFEHQQKTLQEEKERIKYQLELKMERRRHIQLLNVVQDEVVIPVVKESDKALRDYFEQQKHGKAYVKELLAYMESNV
ncbi:MAG: hypothetical protein ACHQVS_03420 [Candidatus Babeliales bacterium]